MPTTAVMIETLIKMRQHPDGIPIDHFWALLERFRADLVNQAYSLLGSQQDAEDVAQESLLRVYLDLHKLREPKKLGNWLRTINRCRALELRRKSQRLKEQRLATGQAHTIMAPDASPEAQETNVAVLREVDQLPEAYREVVVLRYWEKLSTEEIAARLGIPSGTVRSRLTRADGILARRVTSRKKKEELGR